MNTLLGPDGPTSELTAEDTELAGEHAMNSVKRSTLVTFYSTDEWLRWLERTTREREVDAEDEEDTLLLNSNN
jgi:hypothetical protein